MLESLLVMAIVIILLTLSVGVTRSFRENLHLTNAGQLLADQIGAARQLASAHNWTVFVYLFKVPAVSSTGYSALQLWRCAPLDSVNPTMVMLPVDKAYYLPPSVVISEDAAHQSTLLARLAGTGSPPPTLTQQPPTLAGAESVAFAIGPSGRLALEGDLTTADALAACCLTVVPARFGAQSTTPSNFVTVQINPGTGTLLVHRP